jgi:acyl-coenzyme A synthetase/AMP-(fatty) acid ligase
MSLTPYFEKVRELISRHEFEKLPDLPLSKPEYFNWVTEVFEGINLQQHPNLEALLWTDGETEERYTYAQIAKKGNQFLNLLRNNGIKQGDSMFLQLALLPVNWVAYFTAMKGGMVMIPVATIMGVQDIKFRFEKLMPNVVISDLENCQKIEEAEALLGKKVPLKLLADGEKAGWVSFAEIASQTETAEAAQTKADDPLFLFFTSGTTGMPKVVTHTHLSYPLGHLTTASWIGLKQGDIHYNISQPGWAKFSWSCVFAPWNTGATVFAYNQKGRFNGKQQLEFIARYKISTFCAPPTALRMLIQEDLKAFDFSFRECVAAGEPLNPEIIETWQEGTGITIRDGYGQTESTCMVANLVGEKLKFGSMGKPTFLYDIIIADEEGNEMPLHEEGHIAVRTDTGKPNGIFKEYFGDPEKKKDVFRNGLYYTGDKAYKDEDGYIWFVGRDDDVIKASDYRVGPFEVESVLIEHEDVVESAVVGSPHPIKGFQVKAFVILKPGTAPTAELAQEIYAFCRKNLAPYKAPRLIEFVEELPKTISGKIRRVELRANEAQKKARKESSDKEFRFE